MGFEPMNRGFAIRSLSPLGHATVISEAARCSIPYRQWGEQAAARKGELSCRRVAGRYKPPAQMGPQ
jgi:hypothetical protein